MTVGEMAIIRVRIRAAAWKKFGNVAKFAEAAGVGTGTAYAYLGGRNVTLDTLSRLASAAGVVMLSGERRPRNVAPADGGLDREEPQTANGNRPTTTEKGVKDAPIRRWRLLVVTRCSRPENLPEVCRSVRAAAKAAFCKIFHDVRIDAVKVPREALPVIAEAGADAASWHIPAHGDAYMIGSLNAAIQENAQPGDWVVVLDDDTVLTPTAAKIVKRCHEADAGLLVWGAEAPDELLREPRDLAGSCVGRVDFCNFSFRYEVWQKCRFQVAAGGFADGTFVGDAIRLGAKVLYCAEKAGKYNALRGGKR